MSDEFIPRIYRGDFFKLYDKKLRPRTTSLFLSDVPYGLFSQDKDLTGVEDPKLNLEKLEWSLDYLLTKNGTILLFCSLGLLIRLKTGLSKFEVRWPYIFYKSNGSPTHKTRCLNNVEYCAVMKRSEAKAKHLTFNPRESGRVGDSYIKKNYDRNYTTRNITKQEYDRNESGKRWIRQAIPMKSKCNFSKDEIEASQGHPFQKSEKVLRTLIKVHSNPEALIVDGFAGSSSTLIAAYQEGRRSVGFEIDPRWVDVSKERIAKATNQIKIFK